MAIRPIRETTTLDTPPSDAKPGGTELREVTRLDEPRTKPTAPAPGLTPGPARPTAKPDPQ